MAIASARNIGLGGGLVLALALASSAQSIQIQAESASGLSLAARNSSPGICLMETGITYGEWVPGNDGYAGELHGELFDAQTALAYRLRADMHWLALPGPGILPTQGAISGAILYADRGEVVAYLVGDWEQTGTFGRFSALMIDPRFPYQVPPAFIGGIEGDFSHILESNAQDSSPALAQAGGQVQSELSGGARPAPGNLEHDMIFEGYHKVSGSAAPGGAHQDAGGPADELSQGPNLLHDLIFEGFMQVSGAASAADMHKGKGFNAPVQGPPAGASGPASIGNLEHDMIFEGYHKVSGSAAPGGAHQDAGGPTDELSQGPNLLNDLIFEGLHQVGGSAAPGGQDYGSAQPSGAQTSGGQAPGPIEPVLQGVYFGSWTLCQS